MSGLKLDPCLSPFWDPTGHVQTVVGHLLPSRSLSQKGRRIEISLPDGDQLVGFYLEGTSDTAVYLFHGLSGDTDADYIQRTARVCQALGHSVFMINHRGCGAGAGLAKLPYHSGRAEDLSSALEFGKNLLPRHRHLAIGFSLSGNALLLLLTGKRGRTKPDLAVSVNAPIDLERTSHLLSQGFSRIYDLRFVIKCRQEIERRHLAGEEAVKYRIPLFSTLRDFDAIYTAPKGGFESREDYYRSCSTKNLISTITTPTILITAKDDPFVNFQDYVEARLSPTTRLHIEDVGGHMGYLSRSKTPLGTRRWLDYALHESVRALTS